MHPSLIGRRRCRFDGDRCAVVGRMRSEVSLSGRSGVTGCGLVPLGVSAVGCSAPVSGGPSVVRHARRRASDTDDRRLPSQRGNCGALRRRRCRCPIPVPADRCRVARRLHRGDAHGAPEALSGAPRPNGRLARCTDGDCTADDGRRTASVPADPVLELLRSDEPAGWSPSVEGPHQGGHAEHRCVGRLGRRPLRRWQRRTRGAPDDRRRVVVRDREPSLQRRRLRDRCTGRMLGDPTVRTSGEVERNCQVTLRPQAYSGSVAARCTCGTGGRSTAAVLPRPGRRTGARRQRIAARERAPTPSAAVRATCEDSEPEVRC